MSKNRAQIAVAKAAPPIVFPAEQAANIHVLQQILQELKSLKEEAKLRK
jgi:hypothetical protein